MQAMDAPAQKTFIARIAKCRRESASTRDRSGEKMRPVRRPGLSLFRERIRESFGPGAEVYVRDIGATDVRQPGAVGAAARRRRASCWVAFPRTRIERDPVAAVVVWSVAGLAIAILATLLILLAAQPPARRARAAPRSQLGRGGNPPPVAESGPSEIRELARAFNQMKTDLARRERERATFLAGISHDLRTPLARMRLDVEMLEGKVESDVQRGMVRTSTDMNAIIDQFIDFTRSEAAEPLVRGGPVGARAGQRRARRALRRAGRLRPRGRCRALMLRPLAMQRMVDNLLDNAARHAGGEILLRTTREAGSVTLAVLDRGPGIPEDLVERLKQPFTRRDEARSGSSGAGLGLAIANRVAVLHGGRLDLLRARRRGPRSTVHAGTPERRRLCHPRGGSRVARPERPARAPARKQKEQSMKATAKLLAAALAAAGTRVAVEASAQTRWRAAARGAAQPLHPRRRRSTTVAAVAHGGRPWRRSLAGGGAHGHGRRATRATGSPRWSFYFGVPVLWGCVLLGLAVLGPYHYPREHRGVPRDRARAPIPEAAISDADHRSAPQRGCAHPGPALHELLRVGAAYYPKVTTLPRGLEAHVTDGMTLAGARGEERLHVGERARAAERRQRAPDALAVGLVHQPRVADHQRPAVGLVADEPPRPLLERDHRARQLVIHEGIAAGAIDALDARRQHRVVGRVERQPVDHHHRELLALHVHALPERLRADEDRVRRARGSARAARSSSRVPCSSSGQSSPSALSFACRRSWPRSIARRLVKSRKACPPLARTTGHAASITASA